MGAPSVPRLVVSHWQMSWSVVLAAFCAAALYLRAAGRVHGRWPAVRTAAFLAGIACVVVALQSGIGRYDDRVLSVHMVQHMLLLLVAPLLLLLGQPVMLALRTLPPARRGALASGLRRVARVTRPSVCLAICYVVLLLTHLPSFYDATLKHPGLHEGQHLLFMLAGLLLWWPILDVDPLHARRLGGLGRLVYMLAAMPPMALIGSYLNRHPTLVYPGYGPPGHALGISAIADQQQAGALMWVAGNTIMVLVGLWAAIAALVADERRQRVRDARAAAGTVDSGALR